MSVSQLLVVGLAPAPEERTAHAGRTAFRVMVVVFNIPKDSGRGSMITRGKGLVPVSEYVFAGLQDGVLRSDEKVTNLVNKNGWVETHSGDL